MSRHAHVFILLACFGLLTGCSSTKKLNITSTPASLGFLAKRPVAIVFNDLRADVLNGSENQSYCGSMLSPSGTVDYLETQSGKPLAEVFTTFLVQSANDSGWKAEALPVIYNTTEASIISLFQHAKQDRLALINIIHWEVGARPGFSRIAYTMNYEFDLKIFDRDGKLLAGNHIRDFIQKDGDELITKMSTMDEWREQIMSSNKFTDRKKLQMLARISFTNQMKMLFANDSVRASLQ